MRYEQGSFVTQVYLDWTDVVKLVCGRFLGRKGNVLDHEQVQVRLVSMDQHDRGESACWICGGLVRPEEAHRDDYGPEGGSEISHMRCMGEIMTAGWPCGTFRERLRAIAECWRGRREMEFMHDGLPDWFMEHAFWLGKWFFVLKATICLLFNLRGSVEGVWVAQYDCSTDYYGEGECTIIEVGGGVFRGWGYSVERG